MQRAMRNVLCATRKHATCNAHYDAVHPNLPACPVSFPWTSAPWPSRSGLLVFMRQGPPLVKPARGLWPSSWHGIAPSPPRAAETAADPALECHTTS